MTVIILVILFGAAVALNGFDLKRGCEFPDCDNCPFPRCEQSKRPR